ncbi:MAG: beta-aspartyl-peptidase [Deltaproteobacteria bacterium]|nr:beta-aspartyl-peptidase [Deltaproteobacteria bacterium]
MLTLIRGGELFGPEPMGRRDILICGGKIAGIADRIDIPRQWDVEVVDAEDKAVTPGFIDLHVHIIGGGGEGGPGTRVPEIQLGSIVRAGVTTVVGVLGTDDVSRHPETLLAKAMGLEKEGITAYIMVGSYQMPPVTITGSVRKDVALIPHVLGVGEVALSDHRSSQPSFEEVAKLVAEARVGGMLGGKVGVVQFHMGTGAGGMEYLFRLARETEVPIGQFFPTHVTRSAELFEQAIRFAQMGGSVDITASGKMLSWRMKAADAIRELLSAKISMEQITISSDANGSMPIFDENGRLQKLAVGEIQNLQQEFHRLVTEEGLPASDILRCFTLNPARRIGIDGFKGVLKVGTDADLILFDSNWRLDQVFARGTRMVSGGSAVVKGTFE